MFTNATMLLALVALAIPVLVHLLRRRESSVLDWGAMRFLKTTAPPRQRRRIEDWLLLLTRLALIGLIVLALAGPMAGSSWLQGIAGRPPRDYLIVIDTTASMSYDDGENPTPSNAAFEWLYEFAARLRANDRIEHFDERTSRNWNSSPDGLRQERVVNFKAKSMLLPARVEAAKRWLAENSRPGLGRLLVLRDGQRYGWADEKSLDQWKEHVRERRRQFSSVVIDFGGTRPAHPPNVSLSPLKISPARPKQGKPVAFSTSVNVTGVAPMANVAASFRVRVDGWSSDNPPVPAGAFALGSTPITFTRTPGYPLGTSTVAISIYPSGNVRDSLGQDNRQEIEVDHRFAYSAALIPSATDSPDGPTFFLDRALRVAEGCKLAPRESNENPPELLVLADSAELEDAENLLKEGTSLLVFLGPETVKHRDWYNRQSWMPATLDKAVVETEQPERWAGIDASRLVHPALDVFQSGQLDKIRFPGWWKVTPHKDSQLLGSLTNFDPWLIERKVGKCRVLLCTTPADRSWGSAFPSTGEFPIFVQELAQDLAQPMMPSTNPESDPVLEADLTPCDVEDLKRVSEYFPAEYRDARWTPAAEGGELSWLLWAAVLVLLIVELRLGR